MLFLLRVINLKNLPKQKLAMALGARIRELRINLGLTQKELAERCGMLEPNIGAIERGTNTPNISTLAKIATALEADLIDLVRGLYSVISFGSESKEIDLLEKIGFTVTDADDDYMITHNSNNPFSIFYPKKKLKAIISNIIKECEKEKQKAIEERITLMLFEDFLNGHFDILSVERLDELTVETATKLLNFTKMKEGFGKEK